MTAAPVAATPVADVVADVTADVTAADVAADVGDVADVAVAATPDLAAADVTAAVNVTAATVGADADVPASADVAAAADVVVAADVAAAADVPAAGDVAVADVAASQVEIKAESARLVKSVDISARPTAVAVEKNDQVERTQHHRNLDRMNVCGRYTSLADSCVDSDKKARKKERQRKKFKPISNMDPQAQAAPSYSPPYLSLSSADARIKHKLLSWGSAQATRA
jgi:hypothetical protein